MKKLGNLVPQQAKADTTQGVYQWVFDDHPLGLLVLAPDLTIHYANRSLAALLDYQIKDLVGRSIAEITFGKELETAILPRQPEQEASFVQTMPLSFLRASGKVYSTQVMLNATYAAHGPLEQCLVTLLDPAHPGTHTPEPEVEARKEMLFENAPIGIAILHPKTCEIMDVNKSMTHIFRLAKEQLVGRRPLDLSPEIQYDGVKAMDKISRIRTALIAGKQPIFEWQCFDKSDRVKHLEVRLEHIRGADNDHLILMASDITSKKRHDVLLSDSERRFRNLFQDNPLMIFALQKDGQVLAVNKSAIEQLGYTHQELVGSSVLEVFHPDDRNLVSSHLEAFISDDERDATWELRKIRKTGETIWVKEIVRTIDWPGYDEAILVSCENITKQKEAEMVLRKSEERYRSIVDNNLFGIAITRSDGTFEMVNPAFCQMLGYPHKELLALNFIDITAPEDKARSRQASQQMRLRKNRQIVMEKKYMTKGGKKISARSFIKVIDDGTPDDLALVVIQDITDEKRVESQEKELSLKQAEIDHKNRELASYTLFITQKNELLTQISDSLSKLSRIAGTSLRDRIRKLQSYIDQNNDRESDWKQFQMHFQEVNPNFFKILREKYPELTQNELKHCAYVSMHLSVKDVANLLHVSPKAVEVARYRIKKKMALESREDKLSDFLSQFS